MDALKRLNNAVQDTTDNLVRDSQKAANGIANSLAGNGPTAPDVGDNKITGTVPADPARDAANIFDQMNTTLGNMIPQIGQVKPSPLYYLEKRILTSMYSQPADAPANNFSSAPSFGVPPIPRLPPGTRLPRIGTLLDQNLTIGQRLTNFWGEIREFAIRIFYFFLISTSWIMTFADFFTTLATRIFFLPLAFGVRLYERRIRAVVPWLPSIVGMTNALFPMGPPRIPTISGTLGSILKAGQGPLPDLPLPPDLLKDNTA
ncbi:hypothetical protein EVG20_g5528 [Dentipellis fragilis]|uniref:Uncharacterized protein n=1 Tax=Dentipellis fragilis TaxID=205917 RepID=A0A4Y9YSN5_9AGAM|nr:hypothetical protein EVG20_g5528 [Dentipellis fragilis]